MDYQPLLGRKIGFVGLGNMGRANVRHLHKAGAEVIVWNRSDAPAEAAVKLGMKRAASLPKLAREIGDGIICAASTGGSTNVVLHLLAIALEAPGRGTGAVVLAAIAVVAVALLIGAAAPKIAEQLRGALELVPCETLENAVHLARHRSRQGDSVVLAPACASFDQFDNFEHRGREFKRLVRELQNG